MALCVTLWDLCWPSVGTGVVSGLVQALSVGRFRGTKRRRWAADADAAADASSSAVTRQSIERRTRPLQRADTGGGDAAGEREGGGREFRERPPLRELNSHR